MWLSKSQCSQDLLYLQPTLLRADQDKVLEINKTDRKEEQRYNELCNYLQLKEKGQSGMSSLFKENSKICMIY